jgi:hypothetical protein
MAADKPERIGQVAGDLFAAAIILTLIIIFGVSLLYRQGSPCRLGWRPLSFQNRRDGSKYGMGRSLVGTLRGNSRGVA